MTADMPLSGEVGVADVTAPAWLMWAETMVALNVGSNSGLMPMRPRPLDALPSVDVEGGWVFEPFWVGRRVFAVVDPTGRVGLLTERQQMVTGRLPQVETALRRYVPACTILDGVLVCWSRDNRIDPVGLGRRLAADPTDGVRLVITAPVDLVVVDALTVAGIPVASRPLIDRRRLLEGVFDRVPGGAALALTPQTPDVTIARDQCHRLAAAGAGGLVVKPAYSRYLPGDHTTWSAVACPPTAEHTECRPCRPTAS